MRPQQVGQPGEGEPQVASGRSRLHYGEPLFGGQRRTGPQQGCLAGARLPGQHQRTGERGRVPRNAPMVRNPASRPKI
jgi:hypothetical protein